MSDSLAKQKSTGMTACKFYLENGSRRYICIFNIYVPRHRRRNAKPVV